MSSIAIKQFDWQKKLVPAKTIVVFGREHSGRKTAEYAIMKYMSSKFDLLLVCCPNEEKRQEMQRCFPQCHVYESLDETMLQSTIDFVQFRNSIGNKRFRVGLWINDIHISSRQFNSSPMRYILLNGRCDQQFTVLIGWEHLSDATSSFFTQVDYTLVFKTPQRNTRERLRALCFQCVAKEDDFEALHNQLTEDFGFLVHDNTQMSERTEDMVFWGNAANINDTV